MIVACEEEMMRRLEARGDIAGLVLPASGTGPRQQVQLSTEREGRGPGPGAPC